MKNQVLLLQRYFWVFNLKNALLLGNYAAYKTCWYVNSNDILVLRNYQVK